LTAGLYACRAGKSAVLIEEMFTGGQIVTTTVVENYPGFPEGIGGGELGMAIEAQAQRFGLEFVYDTAVRLELEGDVKRAHLYSGGVVEARKVICSMGAKPRRLGLTREEELVGSGVCYCATCDGAFFKGMEVAVIGGGDTACEDALFLSSICPKVTMVIREEDFMSTKVLQDRVRSTGNIDLFWTSEVRELVGAPKLTALTVENIADHTYKTLPVSAMFIAIGTIPRTELVKDALETDAIGAIRTDDRLRTSLPGVYAAGDVRSTPLRQVVMAVADGALAAIGAAREINEE